MELEARYLEIIPQTRYLSAENYVNYRAIMRIFYQEHQKMHYQLDKQTIMGKLRQDRLFSDYSEQQLSQDLDQLIRWKNLTAIQDPRKVRTVADFQNKQYQYMMSQAALEIERMTITLREKRSLPILHSESVRGRLPFRGSPLLLARLTLTSATKSTLFCKVLMLLPPGSFLRFWSGKAHFSANSSQTGKYPARRSPGRFRGIPKSR